MDTNHRISKIAYSLCVLMTSKSVWPIDVIVANTTGESSIESRDSSTTREHPSGESSDQSASDANVKNALDTQRRLSEIDDQFPVASRPHSTPELFRVLQIDSGGVLTLNDGRKLVMDGVECSKSGLEYLSRMFSLEGVSVAFIDQPKSSAQPIPANLWLVEKSSASDPSAFAYMRIAESALSSGWCVPMPTTTSKYDARYAAIALLAQARASKRK